MNTELDFWQGEGGSSYLRRNKITRAEIRARMDSLSKIFFGPPAVIPKNILEVGAGPGGNLLAIHEFLPSSRLFAIEPNLDARNHLENLSIAEVYDGHAGSICAADASFDLVFTAGVLIHIHPDRLDDCLKEIARVSRRHVLCIEYFAPTCEPVTYYGATRIWRNDFGKRYMDVCGLKPVSTGFFWKWDGSGYDNTVWHLLEKP